MVAGADVEVPVQGHPLLRAFDERMFVSMDRQYELETLRRSIGMLQVGAPALDREKAMVLVRELQGMEEQLRRLRGGLQKLLDDGRRVMPVRTVHLNQMLTTLGSVVRRSWGFTDVQSQEDAAKCARQDGHTCVGTRRRFIRGRQWQPD